MRSLPWTTVAIFTASLASIVVLIITGHVDPYVIPSLITIMTGVTRVSYTSEVSAKQLSNGHMKSSVVAAIKELNDSPGEPNVDVIPPTENPHKN